MDNFLDVVPIFKCFKLLEYSRLHQNGKKPSLQLFTQNHEGPSETFNAYKSQSILTRQLYNLTIETLEQGVKYVQS